MLIMTLPWLISPTMGCELYDFSDILWNGEQISSFTVQGKIDTDSSVPYYRLYRACVDGTAQSMG